MKKKNQQEAESKWETKNDDQCNYKCAMYSRQKTGNGRIEVTQSNYILSTSNSFQI